MYLLKSNIEHIVFYRVWELESQCSFFEILLFYHIW